MFHLVYLSLDGEETSLNFKLDSSQSASGLYRAITEKHAFYSCETVRSAVTAQFIRDLKVFENNDDIDARHRLIPLFSLYVQGTIISIFNEDSTLGKKYVFDIRRTCREVYDNARRALYCEAATVSLPEEKEILQKQDCGDCEDPKCKVFLRIEDIDRESEERPIDQPEKQLFRIVRFSGISRMSNKTVGRDAVPHLHGP